MKKLVNVKLFARDFEDIVECDKFEVVNGNFVVFYNVTGLNKDKFIILSNIEYMTL